VSKEIRLHKRFLQHPATYGNGIWRIVAPKGAGSSPLGHPHAEGTQPLVFITEGRGSSKLVNTFPISDGRTSESV
jgi:hypothetical protein